MTSVLRSLSFRLALIYMALFIGSTALLVGAYYLVSIHHPKQVVREHVDRELDALANLYVAYGEDALLKELGRRGRFMTDRRPFHAFIGKNGATIDATLPTWPATLSGGWGRVEADIYLDGDEEDHEALVRDRIFNDGTRLIIGRDIEDIDEREEGLTAAIAWVVGLSLLLSVAGGILMSRAIGKRLDLIARTANQVIQGDLKGRIPLRGSGDDFDRLSQTLNVMLDRIEELLGSVRRVSDTVAHELRTPLARLQAEVDDALRASAPAHDALERVSLEAERLQIIFNALLRIARIEAHRHALELRSVDIAALLRDAAELYGPVAEEQQLRVTCYLNGNAIVAGDADLIFQGISNLLDNAIKFTPAGGEIWLGLVKTADEVILCVRDTGPGIAQEDLQRVTERFYRSDRASSVAGTGLGLSLVEAIANAHRSSLSIQSDEGTSVEWRFPLHTGDART